MLSFFSFPSFFYFLNSKFLSLVFFLRFFFFPLLAPFHFSLLSLFASPRLLHFLASFFSVTSSPPLMFIITFISEGERVYLTPRLNPPHLQCHCKCIPTHTNFLILATFSLTTFIMAYRFPAKKKEHAGTRVHTHTQSLIQKCSDGKKNTQKNK